MKQTVVAKCYDRKGKLLSVGTNSYKKSHPIQAYFASKVGLNKKIYLHAEIAALLKCGKHEVYRIHIERFNKKGEPLLAAPCPICKEAIKAWGISVISYTNGV
jgi:deoxycytidylate deaminase